MFRSSKPGGSRLICTTRGHPVHDVLQSHGGCGHLGLAQFSQEHIIHRELPAPGAHNVFAERRAHPAVVDPYLADIAGEFVPALLAFEVDRHGRVSLCLRSVNDGGNAGAALDVGSKIGVVARSRATPLFAERWRHPSAVVHSDANGGAVVSHGDDCVVQFDRRLVFDKLYPLGAHVLFARDGVHFFVEGGNRPSRNGQVSIVAIDVLIAERSLGVIG